ncbi:hypothetical protein E1A91_A04G137000v1 [Gossypium mustelinum]|uniref:Uncharacterized protein n=5 Tax=Gossypium TaxID=3633 RepID=A0ABR0QD85_GOSAR|nr:uncharacterized protein LOC108459045 [Gossypium arboreum]KAB2087787.1 hypothetical protein ES319_A04G128800v1 [Gossypium barbadense]TYH22616.1 hypothetical protein ES288_A04G143200v1 [Gossypium darwinii]TYI33560.1 hypothetical protein ES332_A04G142400v1 [Gossypium tomentosum]TYJ40378.1 hypothetical protein E1A91_A04G137000v1 [Gossypium mustelinum]KAK5837006.1 hypothetical protein PVK06_012812 [Gossypium arboreum]
MVAGKVVLVSLLFLEVLLVHAMAGGSEAKPPEIKVHKEDDDEPGWVVPREADEPDESTPQDVEAEAPEIRRLGKHHILSSTKSVAAGGVIIAGLVTAAFAVVVAYIRVTRTRDDGVKH